MSLWSSLSTPGHKFVPGFLEAAGSSMARVVRTTVFFTHREDYAGLDAVYEEYFPGQVPSRSALIVAGLVRPEWRVEIDAIAMVG